jgi:hypothetical protein
MLYRSYDIKDDSPPQLRGADMKASRSLGSIALIATAALWGSNHVVARAVREVVPLPALVFWRWGLVSVALLVIALPALRQAWPAIRPRLLDLMIGGAIGVGLFSYLLLGGAYQSLALELDSSTRRRRSGCSSSGSSQGKLLQARTR